MVRRCVTGVSQILTRWHCYHQACTWSPTVMGTVAKPPHLSSRLNQWINIIWQPYRPLHGIWWRECDMLRCVALASTIVTTKKQHEDRFGYYPCTRSRSWPWKICKILSGFGSLTQCNARTLYHNDHCTYTYWISWADVWHQPHLGWRRGLPRLDSADNLS